MTAFRRSFAGVVLLISLPCGISVARADVVPHGHDERAVVGLIDMAFNQKKPAEAFAQFGGPTYRQHNPTAPDGKQAIIDLLSHWLPTVPKLHYDIRRIISKNGMVWIHSRVMTSPEDRGMAVVDIFRLEKGKVVEHWDVGTPVPTVTSNDNGMF